MIAPQIKQIQMRLMEIAQIVAEQLGLVVLDALITQQGARRSLQICIYRKGGEIGLNDCERVSQDIGTLLEQEEAEGRPLWKGAYLLEVVSPGIDRQLTHATEFELFAGKKVRIRAKEKFGSLGNEFTGILLKGNKKSLTLRETRILATNGQSRKGHRKTKIGSKNIEEVPAGQELTIDLDKIFKVNLWSDDLAK